MTESNVNTSPVNVSQPQELFKSSDRIVPSKIHIPFSQQYFEVVRSVSSTRNGDLKPINEKDVRLSPKKKVKAKKVEQLVQERDHEIKSIIINYMKDFVEISRKSKVRPDDKYYDRECEALFKEIKMVLNQQEMKQLELTQRK